MFVVSKGSDVDRKTNEVWRSNMKEIILSADGDSKVYAVPKIVADALTEYCIEFCDKWLRTSPHAKKYRTNRGVCYNEEAFIEYLNTWIYPNEKSKLIENLGWIENEKDIQEKYCECPRFNF